MDIFYNNKKIEEQCIYNIDNNILYKLSSFTYSIAAIYCIIKIKNIKKILPNIPIEILILSVLLNSITSYLSDVIYLNYFNIWYSIDLVLATINTILCILITLIIIFNRKKYKINNISIYALLISIIYGLISKYLSSKNIDDCDKYVFWHIMWHISIPMGVGISVHFL